MIKTKFDVCPTTPETWRAAATAHKVGSVHQLEKIESASSLGVEQFLALKVLWQVQTRLDLFTDTTSRNRWPERLGTNREKISHVRKELKNEASWKEYLKAADQKGLHPDASFSKTLGRFAMVLQNQKIVTKLTVAENDPPKLFGSPMKLRSDDKKGAVAPVTLKFNLGVRKTESESGDPHGKQWSPPGSERSSSAEGGDSQGKRQSPPQPDSASKSIAEGDHSKGKQRMPQQPEMRGISPSESDTSKATTINVVDYYDYDMPKAERVGMADEQVVNTAAISFLQSLFVHDELRNAYWSPQRKGFVFGDTTFRAITDGHLQIAGTTNSAALLEVKARKRPPPQSLDFKIEWQESAQMALWIRDEPSSFWTTEKEQKICR
jgi:hypothetical protein